MGLSYYLFAVDFTEAAYSAGANIKKMAEVFDAKLNLLHVVELPHIDVFPDIPNKEQLYINEAKHKLAGFGKNLQIPVSHQYIEVGNPHLTISDFINAHKIDLVVMGHHERRGLDRILGSTAYAVLERAKIPVLVISYSTI